MRRVNAPLGHVNGGGVPFRLNRPFLPAIHSGGIRREQRVANALRIRCTVTLNEMAACLRLGARVAPDEDLFAAYMAEFDDLLGEHIRLSETLDRLEGGRA